MSFQIDEPGKKNVKNSFSLFALGFRPFFLFAAFFSSLLITLWIFQLPGKITLSKYYPSVGWHAHEMLFGYTIAVISGFLLTAAGNWTGMKVISGWKLILLSFVFLLGRFSPFIAELPYWIIAVVDLSFIPLVALIFAIPVIRARQWSNIIFIPLLLLMATANLLVHLSVLEIVNVPVITGSRMMLYLVILLIVIMGGRVIPFFTERGVRDVSTKKWTWVEYLSPLSVVLLATSDLVFADGFLTACFSLLAVFTHAIRLFGWYSNKIWQVPLVWVLQVAYGWFIIGFIIKALMIFNINESQLAYHALTVGGIGTMTLGMMARVALGHTGHEMKINNWMVLSFILVNVATITRVILPMFFQEFYLNWIKISGSLWVFAFIIFFVVYTPMLIQPRLDGKEG